MKNQKIQDHLRGVKFLQKRTKGEGLDGYNYVKGSIQSREVSATPQGLEDYRQERGEGHCGQGQQMAVCMHLKLRNSLKLFGVGNGI